MLLGTGNAINIYEMDIDELKGQRKQLVKGDKKFENDREKTRKGKVKEIRHTEKVTEVKIDNRTRELKKILDLKDANNLADFKRKERVLQSKFQEAIHKLIRKVRVQRDMLMQAYGPLVLQSKKDELPIFSIHNKDTS